MDLFANSGGSSPPFVRVEYPGEPRAWQRAGARIVTPRVGKPFITFYTQKETKQYEDALKDFAILAMRKLKIVDQAVAVQITATFRVPKSWSDKDRDAALTGLKYPTEKPDWDNVGKLLDAFKGVIWTDDSRVVRALVIKQYGERPSLLIEVYLM